MGTSLRTLISIFLSSVMVICVRPDTVVVVGQKPFVGGGGGPAAFSDNFDRADGASLGANWSEEAGDASIFSNTYRLVTGSFGVVTSVHNTSTGSTTQYIKISLSGIDVQYPWVVFRYLNSSSGYYTLQMDGNTGTVDWYYFSDATDASGDAIGSGGTFGSDLVGDTIAFTITGTGTSTVVRGWLNPTGLPSAADNWNGDTTPEFTLTDDPATAANTGQLVGIGGQTGTANTVRINDFFGGGL
jgi:hypothetical protein